MTLKLDKESLVDRVSTPVNFLVRKNSGLSKKRRELYMRTLSTISIFLLSPFLSLSFAQSDYEKEMIAWITEVLEGPEKQPNRERVFIETTHVSFL